MDDQQFHLERDADCYYLPSGEALVCSRWAKFLQLDADKVLLECSANHLPGGGSLDLAYDSGTEVLVTRNDGKQGQVADFHNALLDLLEEWDYSLYFRFTPQEPS